MKKLFYSFSLILVVLFLIPSSPVLASDALVSEGQSQGIDAIEQTASSIPVYFFIGSMRQYSGPERTEFTVGGYQPALTGSPYWTALPSTRACIGTFSYTRLDYPYTRFNDSDDVTIRMDFSRKVVSISPYNGVTVVSGGVGAMYVVLKCKVSTFSSLSTSLGILNLEP